MRRGILVACAALALGVAATGAAADTVYLTNGGHLEGIATENADGIVVAMRRGKVWLKPSQVQRIERRETPEQRFARERAAVLAERPGDLDARVALAERARADGLRAEAEAELHAVLAVDEGHPGARRALGVVFHAGNWVTDAERRRLMGFVLVDGEWLTADEARVRTERRVAEADAARLEAEGRLADARAAAAEAEADRSRAEAEAARVTASAPVVVADSFWGWPFAGTRFPVRDSVCDPLRRRAAPIIDPHTRRRLAGRDPFDPHVRLLHPAAADPHAMARARAAQAARAAGLPEPDDHAPLFSVRGAPHCR